MSGQPLAEKQACTTSIRFDVLEIRARAQESSARERWVTPEGFTQLPEEMRDALGLRAGGHLWFLSARPGRWEAWSAAEFDEQLGLGQEPESEVRVASELDDAVEELREVLRAATSSEDDALRERLAEIAASELARATETLRASCERARVDRAHELRPRGPTLRVRNYYREYEAEAIRRTATQVVTADGRRFDLRRGVIVGGSEHDYLDPSSLETARAMPVGPTDLSRALDAIRAREKGDGRRDAR